MYKKNISSREIKRLKKLFKIPEEMEIVVKIDNKINKDVCATTEFEPCYRRACITIYTKAISDVAKTFQSETIKAVLYHEFGEIVALECIRGVKPESRKDDDFMIQIRDWYAERISKIVLDLENKIKNKRRGKS